MRMTKVLKMKMISSDDGEDDNDVYLKKDGNNVMKTRAKNK